MTKTIFLSRSLNSQFELRVPQAERHDLILLGNVFLTILWLFDVPGAIGSLFGMNSNIRSCFFSSTRHLIGQKTFLGEVGVLGKHLLIAFEDTIALDFHVLTVYKWWWLKIDNIMMKYYSLQLSCRSKAAPSHLWTPSLFAKTSFSLSSTTSLSVTTILSIFCVVKRVAIYIFSWLIDASRGLTLTLWVLHFLDYFLPDVFQLFVYLLQPFQHCLVKIFLALVSSFALQI